MKSFPQKHIHILPGCEYSNSGNWHHQHWVAVEAFAPCNLSTFKVNPHLALYHHIPGGASQRRSTSCDGIFRIDLFAFSIIFNINKLVNSSSRMHTVHRCLLLLSPSSSLAEAAAWSSMMVPGSTILGNLQHRTVSCGFESISTMAELHLFIWAYLLTHECYGKVYSRVRPSTYLMQRGIVLKSIFFWQLPKAIFWVIKFWNDIY